jgi:predicted MFS family arabinose efflux permease
VVLSIVGVVSLVFGLIQAPVNGWLDPTTLIAFGISAVFLFAFVLYERRVDEPMVDMGYFRNPAFSTATGCMILVFLAMYGLMFLITQYLQLVQGYSALGAAVRLLPTALVVIVVSPFTPRISARLGANRAVALGMSLAAVGMLSFVWLDQSTAYPQLILGFIVTVVGLAMTMSPMTAAIMSAVPTRRAGAGSATNDATRELGAALGIAVLGSIAATHYTNAVTPAVDATLSGPAAAAAKASVSGALDAASSLGPAAQQTLVKAANDAFIGGLHLAVLVGAILAAGAAVVVLRKLPHVLVHHEGGGDPAYDRQPGVDESEDDEIGELPETVGLIGGA